MRISVKCSSAVHILLMIAVLSPREKVTSELLASSVGNNPAETRKLLSGLKRAGIIDVARGPGGAKLQKAPEEITLYDIYSAVDAASLDELIGLHTHPSMQCLFGKNISKLLSEPYEEIGEAVKEKMSEITLKELLLRLYELEHAIGENPVE